MSINMYICSWLGCEDMKITVREMTMVKPVDETPRRTLWSSNLDVVQSNSHVEIVFFYRSNGDANFFHTQILKDALSRALGAFYPLGGRLKKDQNGRIEVNCQGQGVLFVEAESDGVIDDFGEFAPTMELRKLIPAVDYSLPIESIPILILQVTYFKCGGVSLGVGMLHSVVDAASMIHFINTWSDTSRGLDLVTVPPFIDRTLLSARNPPRPAFEHVEFKPAYSPSALKSLLLQTPPSDETMVHSIFKLTRDQLDALKVKSKEDGSTINYSTFELLAGHIWKCMCEARGLSDDQETKLYLAIDGRTRFQPNLPTGYFGNCVVMGTTPTTVAGEVKSNPSWYAASKIHDAIVIRDNNYLRSTLDYLELHLSNMHTKGVSFGIVQSCKSSNLLISSWAKLPLFDADFGWGPPIFVGPAGLLLEGFGFVLPSPNNDGGLSFFIRLKLEHHKLFNNLFYDI